MSNFLLQFYFICSKLYSKKFLRSSIKVFPLKAFRNMAIYKIHTIKQSNCNFVAVKPFVGPTLGNDWHANGACTNLKGKNPVIHNNPT